MTMLDQTLGQLARTLTGATAVFNKHQLNFCCSGNQSLGDAIAERRLDAAAITAELEQLAAQDNNEPTLANASDEELIEHILARFHDTHRQQLPELIRLAGRVELVHGGNPHCPSGLAYHLEQMKEELEEHMRKEEQMLFPMIARGMKRVALQPVAVMRRDHDDHAQALQKIAQLTYDLTLPPGACNTWRALYLGLATLRDDLIEHIHLENNVLFNRIDGEFQRPQTSEEPNHG